MTGESALDVDRERFRELAAGARPAVVRATATLPATSPLSAYAALTGRTSDCEPAEYAFLLESAGKTAGSDPDGAFRPPDDGAERHARYSFVGYDPEAVVTVEPDGASVDVLGDEKYGDLLSVEADGDALDQLRAAMPDVRLAGFPDRGPSDRGSAERGSRAGGSRPRLQGGLVGFLAYDAVYDAWLDEVGVERPDSRFPDAQFVLTTRTVSFDHVADEVSLVLTPVLRGDDDPDAVYDRLLAEVERVSDRLGAAAGPEPGGFRRAREEADPREAYEDAVRRAKAHVRDGDVYQAVVSRKRELYGEVDPLGLYASLRDVNPSPYMYLLSHDDLSVVGASPETLVSVGGRRVVANPIAGTCPRGAGPVEDRRLAGEMLADEKERAEHTMLVDLARNDVRRVSEPGSVRVEEFMDVLKYSHVQHIESTVTGRLANGAGSSADGDDSGGATADGGDASPDAFDATRAAFPAGTLAGAPKIRAMELIDELERDPRGLYGGGVGYYAWTGDADTAIVIRSATVEDLGDETRTTVRAGAGVVDDSDPAAEFEETESKMDGVLAALERIEHEAPAPEAR